MTTEPKLFTLAEAQDRFGDTFTAELRERGLIAEEPVDPVAHIMALVRRLAPDSEIEQAIRAIVAPRKELTREMVREALREDVPISGAWSNAVIDSIRDKIAEALQ